MLTAATARGHLPYQWVTADAAYGDAADFRSCLGGATAGGSDRSAPHEAAARRCDTRRPGRPRHRPGAAGRRLDPPSRDRGREGSPRVRVHEADLRAHLAPLLGLAPAGLRHGRLSYELRRLRLHGLIERLPRTHRYRVTHLGLRTAIFATRAYARLLRPGFATAAGPGRLGDPRIRRPFEQLELALDRWVQDARLDA